MNQHFTTERLLELASGGKLEELKHFPEHMLAKPDATGVRAMHVAAQHGHVNILEWLVESAKRDLGVNVVDEDARTPLHWAAWYGQHQAAAALIEMGSIPDRATRTGFTPLHYACFVGSLDTCRVLAEAGVKVDVKDESGQTPGDVALRFHHKLVAEFMETDAVSIASEARKRGAVRQFVPAMDQGDAQLAFPDPIVESAQDNEFKNLERIVQTASALGGNDGSTALTPQVVAKAAVPDKDAASNDKQQQVLLLSAVLFFLSTTTLLLAVVVLNNKNKQARNV